MKTARDWKQIIQIERSFTILEDKILKGSIQDYRQIHPEAFAWHGWDLISEERLLAIILPFLRQQIKRAKSGMPLIYGDRLADIEATTIRSADDWQRVPILVKDEDREYGLAGFRQVANQNPTALRPGDADANTAVFGSGGSLGKYTPTFVTMTDRARETNAWRRGHDYHGLTSGDTVLYTYNTTHKGGQWMQESLWAQGANVILRRPEEGAQQVLENIKKYGVNVLFTVQQPYEAMHRQDKASGINLHNLVLTSLENPEYHGLIIPSAGGEKQVEFIFLGGFEIVPYAMELVETYLANTPVATLLGSSEAIPQACSTNPVLTPGGPCHYNNLHLLHGPHYIEIVKPEDGGWVPVEKGEEGLLVYTSWARDGTIWIRYAPGDVATKALNEGECPCGIKSPVITNVHRKDVQERAELLIQGCAAG